MKPPWQKRRKNKAYKSTAQKSLRARSKIDIKSHNDLDIPYDSFLKKAPYFDRQWVAFHKFNDQVGLFGIPERVGILLLDGGEYKVLRKAKQSPLAGIKSLETAKVSLTKFLKG